MTPTLTIYATQHRLGTVEAVRRAAPGCGFRVRVIAYEKVPRLRRAPAGAAILSDLERLAPPWLEFAGKLRACILAAGAPVMNDPLRFLPRAAFLRRMRAAGVNGFDCHMPAMGEWPARFPVFLRTFWGHRGVIGDLLHDRRAAEAALEDAIGAGHALSDLGFIEFAGNAPSESGVWRKLAAYVIGDAVVPALTVSDRSWVAKTGVEGAATAEEYAADLSQMEDYPHADFARRVAGEFGQQFGRIDFCLVNGRPEAFEWNTNPAISFSHDHPDPSRVAAGQRSERELMAALTAFAHRGAGCPAPGLPRAWRRRTRFGRALRMP